MEEYARKSVFDRETIFFKDTFEKIETALSRDKTDRRILRFKYETASGQIITCHVQPYGIVGDPAVQYHYLVGLSKVEGSDDYSLASFRISRIQDDTIIEHAKSYGSGSIPESKRKAISAKIEANGVQFLMADEEIIRIQLTPAGLQMYNTMHYMHPASSSVRSIERQEDGSVIYEFSCTRRQIEYYFFKFGKEATVLEPTDLVEKFKGQYKDALAQYEE